MIQVLPITDRETVRCFYEKSGLLFGEDSRGVVATAGDDTIGFCLFDLTERGILVLKLDPENDPMLADGILRAALHVAAERSAMDAHYAGTVSEALLEKLDFIVDRSEKRIDIDKLFRGCTCCHE